MKKFLFFIVIVVGLSSAAYFAYVRQPSRQAAAPSLEQSQETSRSDELRTRVVTYLDVSQSMAGFFRTTRLPGSVIQRFLWVSCVSVLREKLSTEQVFFATFGDATREPDELGPAESLLERLRFESRKIRDRFFADRDTKLVELFEDIKLRTSRMFIVVTDGIPSNLGQAGVDPRLIATLQDLALNGMHLWLVGVRSEFDGRVYPETPDAYGRQKSFLYKGLRPVYIWVGSTNKKQGTEVAAAYLKALRLLLVESDAAKVEVAEITSVELSDVGLTLEADVVPEVLAIERPEFTELRLASGFEGSIRIPLKIRWLDEELLPKAKRLEWAVLGAGQKEASVESIGDKWHLIIDPRRASAFEVELRAYPIINEWWSAWSTIDDSIPTNANKTLYLNDLIRNLRAKEEHYSSVKISLVVD